MNTELVETLRRWQRLAQKGKYGAAAVDYVTLRDAADEIDRLQAIVDRINPNADGATIEAWDCAYNLFLGRVTKDEAMKIWPWLAECKQARNLQCNTETRTPTDQSRRT